MSEDPLRLTEMSDPPPELIALVRRMEGPPPLPPELPGLLPPRPRLRIVGPTLALVAIAAGAYPVYRMIDAPPPPERIAPPVVVEAPPPALAPPPEPVIARPIVEPQPLEAPPTILLAPAEVRARPRPRAAPAEPDSIEIIEPFGEATEAGDTGERGHGRVLVQTIPWARVLIDGRDTGRSTPTELRVPAGRHRIGLRTEDGAVHTVVVTIEAGETTRIVRQLGPLAPQPSPRPQRFESSTERPF